MVIPSIEELNELEKHLYVQAFYCFGVGKAQEIYTELEKRNILNMLNEGSSESENTFCKSSILLAQIIKTLEELKGSIEKASDSCEKNNLLKMLFNQYEEAFEDLYGLPPAFIHRISGLRGNKNRNRKFLYRKYEIFYEILKQYAEKHGKFENATQAVKSVFSEVIEAFQQFDRNYALEKINELDNQINNEKRSLTKPKSKEFPTKLVSTQKRIKKLEMEKINWRTTVEKNKLYEAFPTIFLLNSEDYLEEILARELKTNIDIYNQVIKPNTV
ncbi:hypothetical protein ACT40Q_00380 [Acinetobacter baumannii]